MKIQVVGDDTVEIGKWLAVVTASSRIKFECFLHLKSSRKVLAALSPGVQWPSRKSDCSVPSNAKVETANVHINIALRCVGVNIVTVKQ